jgi:hypothetical protein
MRLASCRDLYDQRRSILEKFRVGRIRRFAGRHLRRTRWSSPAPVSGATRCAPLGRKSGRSAHCAAHQVRFCYQPQDRQGARANDPGAAAGPPHGRGLRQAAGAAPQGGPVDTARVTACRRLARLRGAPLARLDGIVSRMSNDGSRGGGTVILCRHGAGQGRCRREWRSLSGCRLRPARTPSRRRAGRRVRNIGIGERYCSSMLGKF